MCVCEASVFAAICVLYLYMCTSVCCICVCAAISVLHVCSHLCFAFMHGVVCSWICLCSSLWLHLCVCRRGICVVQPVCIGFVCTYPYVLNLCICFAFFCLTFSFVCVTRITQPDYYVRFSPPYPPGSITMKNASDTRRVNTPFPIQSCTGMGWAKVWCRITSEIHTRF